MVQGQGARATHEVYYISKHTRLPIYNKSRIRTRLSSLVAIHGPHVALM